jgi:hypothetical protein
MLSAELSTMHARVQATFWECTPCGDTKGCCCHTKEELEFEASVGVREGTALWLEDRADLPVRGDDKESRKGLLFARAMTCFMVDRVFQKLVFRVTVGLSLGLLSAMSAVGVTAHTGAEVSPEA